MNVLWQENQAKMKKESVTKERILSELFVPEYMSKVDHFDLARHPLVKDSNCFIDAVCTLSVKELEDHNESFRDAEIAGISAHYLKTGGQFWGNLWNACFQSGDTTLENALILASWLLRTEAEIRDEDEYWLVPEPGYTTKVFTEYGAFSSFVARKLEPVQRIGVVVNFMEGKCDWRLLNLIAAAMESHALWGLDNGHEIDRYIKVAGLMFIQADPLDEEMHTPVIDDCRLLLGNTLMFAQLQLQRLEPPR